MAILASTAEAQAVTEWDLPGQPLANSLRDIAARTDSNIIFDKKLVRGQSAPPLKTRATTEEALLKVLEGTGLTYRQLDDKTVTIQLASTDPAAATSSNYSSNGRIRLAQAEIGSATMAPRPAPETRMPPSVMLLEEIIVTGTNIRGIENNTAPITVLSRAYIDATGYSTTTRLLESVTQNFALTNQSSTNLTGVSNSNREQGSGINLRGLGEGTTLVLVNGRRLAPGYKSASVDISALPLSAIERVEILPDGASALYGSDAVGGVVNFILRDDFEGVETRLRAGVADGVDEYQASQAVGNSWDSGNFLASVEYFKRDLLLATDRDFVMGAPLIGSLLPEDENYSGIVTLRQEIAGPVSLFVDGLFSKRDSFNQGGRVTLNETTQTDNTQGVMTAGVDWNVAGDWQVELSGSYARNDLEQELNGRLTNGASNNFLGESLFEIEAAELKADGSLFQLPGGNLRVAIGAGWRGESYEDSLRVRETGAVTFRTDKDQTVRSAFGEVYVPVVGKDNAMTGVNRLELSLAARYDDYSTAGSSVDPQAGLMWEPVGGLRLRARHSTSYKAPNLVDYNFANNIGISSLFPVPGSTPQQVFQVRGIDVDSLAPQESESSSFGLEIEPQSMPGLSVALNYYKIRYTDLIATPAAGNPAVILANPGVYGDLIIRDPSVDLVNQFIAIAQQGGRPFRAVNPNGTPNPNFTPALVDIIVDGRRRNLSLVRAEGLDLSAQYDFKVAESRVFLGLNGTYILNQEQQVTDTSPAIETVDTIYNPPNWRARGFVGWQLQGWGANLFVNHTDSYVDNRTLIRPAVDSFTTVDTRFSYDFSNRFSNGVLSGLAIAVSAQNVLDEDPPRTAAVAGTFDPGFDATNASPLGRFISLEVIKAW